MRELLRAVDDVNSLDPQPDFVLYGGDLAQLGQPEELELGAQILKNLKAPVRMMVGEHDWYLDMGEKWRELFGEPTYSFDHKGVHFVVLNSVVEKDFWTARGMTPDGAHEDRRRPRQRRPEPLQVGDDAARVAAEGPGEGADADTPLIVFSHSPLYKLLPATGTSGPTTPSEVQAILKRFNTRHGDPRPHAPAADQPHRQHPLPRHALDRLAVAVRAARACRS